MNEWYARDVSKKVKAANRVRGMSGEPLSLPPYGYMKDPENPKRWVVDPEAAAVVKRIFEMGLSGMGTDQIADALSADNILNPTAYWMSKGQKRRGGIHVQKSPFTWSCSTIGGLFKTQEYCGDVINFKTVSKSYRSRKRVKNAPENVVVFKDVHKAIVSREDYERLQAKRVNITRKRTSPTRRNIFSGLARCPDCGTNLTFNINSRNKEITFYKCKNYHGGAHTCKSTHYVRVDFLEQVVLADIRRIIRLARIDEALLIRNLADKAVQDLQGECSALKQSIDALNTRDAELNRLFEQIYEDKTLGDLSVERFTHLSKRYDEEQRTLRLKIARLEEEFDAKESKRIDVNDFVQMAKRCKEIKRLTPKLLHQFIDWIEVHQSVKVNGVYHQRIEIYYNCVGLIQLSSEAQKIAPEKEITLDTRKGVMLTNSYAQAS
jgi:hypothetical protein